MFNQVDLNWQARRLHHPLLQIDQHFHRGTRLRIIHPSLHMDLQSPNKQIINQLASSPMASYHPLQSIETSLVPQVPAMRNPLRNSLLGISLLRCLRGMALYPLPRCLHADPLLSWFGVDLIHRQYLICLQYPAYL